MLLITALVPFAAFASAETDQPLTVSSQADIRALAEIDGDPDTFTDEEARKLAVLEQVLGPVADAGSLPAPATPTSAPMD